MIYVADTHGLVYHIGQTASKLGRQSQRLFRKADEGKLLIHIPTIVLWEVGRPGGFSDNSESFEYWCQSLKNSPGYTVEPLEWRDVKEARLLPFRDPADCLIVGTAIRLGYPLITKDQQIVDSGLVETIW